MNFKFAWAQFKNVWIILLAFLIVLAVWVAIGAFASNFGQGRASYYDQTPNEKNPDYPNTSWGSHGLSGAGEVLNQLIFGFPFLAIFFGFGIAMSMTLINKDITRGYIASWLTTPLSRLTVFNSKLFVLTITTIIANLWIIILEMIIFGLRMGDFSAVVGNLLMGNLALLFLSLLIVAITWFIFSCFVKTGLAIGVSIGILAWFCLCYILLTISNSNESLKNLKYFKYFTIFSFFNSPLQFADLPNHERPSFIPPLDQEHHLSWVDIAQILPLKALDYAWQLPVMLVGATGLFTGAQFLIKSKDFAF